MKRAGLVWLVLLALPSCGRKGSTGNGAPTTGPGVQQACLDGRRATTADEVLPIGFAASSILALAGGLRESPLTWARGGSTTVKLILEKPLLTYVESRRNPNYPFDVAFECPNHLLIESPVRLTTADGQLEERWAEGQLRAMTAQVAEMVLVRDAKDLRGKYQQSAPSGRCLLGLQVDLRFSSAGFSGEILESVSTDPCGAGGPNSGVSPLTSGSWGPERAR